MLEKLRLPILRQYFALIIIKFNDNIRNSFKTQFEYLEWMLWAFACVHHLETIANTMMAEDAENSRAKRWVAVGFLLA